MSSTKECSRCKNEKLLEEFGKDRRRSDGLKAICRACDREVHWLRYHSNESLRQKTLETAKRSYEARGRIRLQQRRQLGLCYFCDKPAVGKTTRCKEHTKKALRLQPDYYRARYRKLKSACLGAYGNACACCGESNWKFLTIDHVNGGGSKHRKEINSGNMLEWLYRNKFPAGFQTLCYNCNCGRERNGGQCPHKDTQPDLLFIA